MILTRTSKTHGTHDILIDDQDLHLLQGWGLYVIKRRTYFARLYRYEDGVLVQKYLHNAILGLKQGEIARFLNGNGLDCRRQNLEKQTNSCLAAYARTRIKKRSGRKKKF